MYKYKITFKVINIKCYNLTRSNWHSAPKPRSDGTGGNRNKRKHTGVHAHKHILFASVAHLSLSSFRNCNESGGLQRGKPRGSEPRYAVHPRCTPESLKRLSRRVPPRGWGVAQ